MITQFTRSIILALLLLIGTAAFAQVNFPVQYAHAHNDYQHQRPFYEASSLGFGSIEADIWLNKNQQLVVAHDKKSVVSAPLFRMLYLIPIQKELIKKKARPLSLLIDLKEDYTKLLPVLIKELSTVQMLCKRPGNNNSLTIILTGKVPPPAEYQSYPDFIFFDNNLSYEHNASQWQRVALVSLKFSAYSDWKNTGLITNDEKNLVIPLINFVHQHEKKIRFWDAPDDVAGWRQLIDLHVDVIGTDKLRDFQSFSAQTAVK